MKTYIEERIKDKIIIQIQSYVNAINHLFKIRHQDYSKQEIEMNYKLINFQIRNLRVWKEIKKRNTYYEKRIQK